MNWKAFRDFSQCSCMLWTIGFKTHPVRWSLLICQWRRLLAPLKAEILIFTRVHRVSVSCLWSGSGCTAIGCWWVGRGTGGCAAASYFLSSVFRSNLHMAMDSNRTSVSCGARLASWRFVEKWDGWLSHLTWRNEGVRSRSRSGEQKRPSIKDVYSVFESDTDFLPKSNSRPCPKVRIWLKTAVHWGEGG